MPLLVAHQICKRFQEPQEVEVLKGVDVSLEAGEVIAIMGASGEGKSTLLHILGMLEPPSSGTLEICGVLAKPTAAARLRRRHMGFIFQAYHLLPDSTALDNVLLPAHIAGHAIFRGSEAYARALALLEHVGLGHRCLFLTKLLSGGEKQRVAIARALMNNPHILLADEPSGNLDQATSTQIHHLLIDAAKKHNKGLLIVTHHEGLAQLCDRRLILYQGKLYQNDVKNSNFGTHGKDTQH